MLTSLQREHLTEKIKEEALSFAYGEVSCEEINQLGITQATQKGFERCLFNLSQKADFVLVDAFPIRTVPSAKQLALKHGDSLCASIAAASIVAKVYRDQILCKLHRALPFYSFEKNKGYGTKQHQLALANYSLSREHRKNFNLSRYLPAS